MNYVFFLCLFKHLNDIPDSRYESEISGKQSNLNRDSSIETIIPAFKNVIVTE